MWQVFIARLLGRAWFRLFLADNLPFMDSFTILELQNTCVRAMSDERSFWFQDHCKYHHITQRGTLSCTVTVKAQRSGHCPKSHILFSTRIHTPQCWPNSVFQKNDYIVKCDILSFICCEDLSGINVCDTFEFDPLTVFNHFD